jgi:hypothetical protein
MPSRCRGDKQSDEACQVAEEMRGPPSGRAQEGRRQPLDEINGSRPKSNASYGRL